jgi:hypothetical protein
MHQRQAIREAVVAALSGKTAAETRVYATREVPWKRLELPGISVYCLEEEKDQGKLKVQVAVLLVAALTEKVDDALDDLALEVENAMALDMTLGRTAMATRYTGMQVEISEEQGRPVGAMRLLYDAWYQP